MSNHSPISRESRNTLKWQEGLNTYWDKCNNSKDERNYSNKHAAPAPSAITFKVRCVNLSFGIEDAFSLVRRPDSDLIRKPLSPKGRKEVLLLRFFFFKALETTRELLANHLINAIFA